MITQCGGFCKGYFHFFSFFLFFSPRRPAEKETTGSSPSSGAGLSSRVGIYRSSAAQGKTGPLSGLPAGSAKQDGGFFSALPGVGQVSAFDAGGVRRTVQWKANPLLGLPAGCVKQEGGFSPALPGVG